jgi:hypothetical protein
MTTIPTPDRAGRAPTTKGRGERLFWALLLIWAALVIGADGLGLLPQVGSAGTWNWIFFGAGILATEGCLRHLITDPRHEVDLSSVAVAGVLLVIGLDGFAFTWVVASVVMLLMGLVILVADRRRSFAASE